MAHQKGVITASQQLQYLAQWLQEMSEMQTQDFMKCLIDKYSTAGHRSDQHLLNGLTQLGVQDKPPSIFQCRMKLFSEWFAQWSDEEKTELLVRLRNVNSKFMDEFQTTLESGPAVNGPVITDDDYQSHQTLNGNVDDDSKTSEQLVINGVHSETSPEPEPVETETVANEKSVVAEEEEEPKQAEVVEESEPQEVIVGKAVVDEVTKDAELIVNGIEANSEVQEVVG